jgi:cobalt-zinc-cadmium efflux system outer membrane protein
MSLLRANPASHRRRTFPLVVGLLALASGCRNPAPDMRDFAIADIPAVMADVRTSEVMQAGATLPHSSKEAATVGKAPQLLRIPPELPGSDAPPIETKPGKGHEKDRFPDLPAAPAEPDLAESPTGKPLTLVELEQIALANNPVIRQAAADVAAARGRATQAGLYPNPELGYQADQINSGRGVQTRGQQGGYVAWVLKTGGKLQLARLAALMDYFNAQVALRKAQLDLINQVRANYFAVLVAREATTVNRALAKFTEDLYAAQQGLVKGAEQAPYEPLQSYAMALQARALLLQSRNRYASAWRQLAASLGRPEMPPTDVAGRADAPAPAFDIDQLRDRAMARHTDVLTAENNILQARYNLRLAEVTPIPDIRTQIYIERDWSTPPYNTQVGVQSGGPIPVFDRNQGNILAAKAQLARAIQTVPRARNDLANRLAQAFETYETNRALVAYYRDRLIPSQVQVYRAVSRRYQVAQVGELNYKDVLTAQQNLGTSVANYLTALGSLWNAVIDLASIAQLDELYLPPPGACDGELKHVLDPATTSPPAPAPAPPTPAPRPVPPATASAAFVGPPKP